MDFPGWHPWYIAWLCHAYHMAFEKTPYILSRHCSWQTTTTRLLPLLLLGYIIFNSLWCLIFHTQFATVGGVREMWMTKMHPGPKSAACSEWLLFYVMTGSWYYHFTCCCFFCYLYRLLYYYYKSGFVLVCDYHYSRRWRPPSDSLMCDRHRMLVSLEPTTHRRGTTEK